MVRRVADGVYLLEVSWPEPIGSNAYLVDDGTVTLVDTGLPVPRRSIAGELQAVGYSVSSLDRILLTHYDIDHVGGVGRLDVDVPVYLGAADLRLVRRSWSPAWTHHKGLFHRFVRRLFPLSNTDLRPVADADRIGKFRAIHTPGHNPGHTVFLHDELDAAFLGDLVWESDGTFVSPPWLDSYDMAMLRSSIDRVSGKSFQHACVGHGNPLSAVGGDTFREFAAKL